MYAPRGYKFRLSRQAAQLSYSSQASVAHLPHPAITYSWDTALNLVAYPVISYLSSPRRGAFHAPTDDNEISLDLVHYSDARQLAPTRKPECPEEREARIIVSKDKTKKGINLEGRCLGYCLS
jgi:hypothetical protein